MKPDILEEMDKLRRENRKLTDELNRIKNGKDVSMKIRKPRDLPFISAKCILEYMDPNKRLLTSHFNPKFRELEKLANFKLDHLEITNSKIVVNNVRYDFRDEQGRIAFSDPQFPMHMTSGGNYSVDGNIEDAVQKVAFEFFAERRNFQVDTFHIRTSLPFKLNIDVGNIFIARNYGSFQYSFRNMIGKKYRLIVFNLSEHYGLGFFWLRDVRRLEMLEQDKKSLIQSLRNDCLRAEEIYVYFYDFIQCIDVIRNWLERKELKIGSKLYLVIHRNKEFKTIFKILHSKELAKIGFTKVSPKIYRKPLETNAEAWLTIREDKEHFSKEFTDNTNFNRYLCIEMRNCINCEKLSLMNKISRVSEKVFQMF